MPSDRRLRTARTRLWVAVVAVVAPLMGGFGLCRWADAGTTTTYSGPTGFITIDLGDTGLLVDGASVTGNITNNGTLEFGLTNSLEVGPVYSISGSGNVLLTESGTITFSGSNSYLNGTTISYGELVITGGGVINHPDASTIVGNVAGDTGTLRLAGGSVTNKDGDIGKAAGSRGTAYVTSGTWANTGEVNIGLSGTGALILSGGSVTVAGSGILGRDTSGFGELLVSSGSLTVGSVLNVGQGGIGLMTISGGLVSDVDGYIGANGGSSGTATITSGTWFNSGNLIVGFRGGSATLNISGGGVVVVGDTLSRDPLLGTINLGPGGTLVIGTGTDAGALDTDLTNNGTLIFDRSNEYVYGGVIDGSGVVVKRGDGTLRLTGSNSYQGGTTILGGRIDVSGTGAIDHQSATLSIGDASGAIGGLDVTTGGTVKTLLLDIANGDMTLTSGLVTSGTARIGAFGSGTATLNGGVFTISDLLYVGYSGTGTMNVNDGNVGSAEAILGTFGGDYGAVSVTDAGVWENFGNLTVGGAGTGVLSISSGGSVLVTGTLSKGGGGTINLNDGSTLRIGNGGATGALATDLTNNGLLEFNRSTAYTYAGQIDGSGAVTKLGSNALTFSGSSSYTGLTTIDAGSFYVDGQLGLTAVSVNPGALLGGSGTVLGSVSVGTASGTAVISPGSLGDPYATLTVGSLSLAAGSLTQLSISGTEAGINYDQIAGADPSTATLFYGGDMAITLSGSYVDNTTFYLFADFQPPSGNFRSISLDAAGSAYASISGEFTYDASAGVWMTGWTTAHQRLVFSAVKGELIVVPEPSTLVMATVGVGLAAGLRWRRRRRRARLAESTTDAAGQA